MKPNVKSIKNEVKDLRKTVMSIAYIIHETREVVQEIIGRLEALEQLYEDRYRK